MKIFLRIFSRNFCNIPGSSRKKSFPRLHLSEADVIFMKEPTEGTTFKVQKGGKL